MTDDNGQGSFTGLGGGEVTIQAQLEGYGAASANIVIDAANDPPELELRLRAAARLEVVITDALGAPVHDGSMSILGPGDRTILSTQFSTREGGRLAINDVEPGLWTFLFSGSSTATIRRTLRVPESADADSSVVPHIQLPSSGNLRIEAPSLADSRAAVSVTLLTAEGHTYTSARSPHLRAQTLSQGTAILFAVPVGTYTVRLFTQDGSVNRIGTATVLANVTNAVTIP